MASNWRNNREAFGWGGFVRWNGTIGFTGVIPYLIELNPPVNMGSFIMTYMTSVNIGGGLNLFLGGNLLMGCFQPLFSSTAGILRKPWLRWPVVAD